MNHVIARYNAGELAGAAAAAALFGTLFLLGPSASAPEPQSLEFPVDCLMVAAQPERPCLYY